MERDVTEVNMLLYAGGVVGGGNEVEGSNLAMRLKVGNGKKGEQMKPWWQRRIENNIEMWRNELSQVEEIRKGGDVGGKARRD